MKKKIVILGSTGSIGRTTVNLIKKDKKKFNVILLTTYKNINNPLKVGRYHSLQVSAPSEKLRRKSLKITAIDPVRDVPMSFEDTGRRLFGLQYHPESFLTNQGEFS